jgi:hypothetical protein
MRNRSLLSRLLKIQFLEHRKTLDAAGLNDPDVEIEVPVDPTVEDLAAWSGPVELRHLSDGDLEPSKQTNSLSKI